PGRQRREREERTAEVRPCQACQLLLLRSGVILGRQAFAGHGINLLLQHLVECSRGNVIPLLLILRVRLFGAQHLLPIFGPAGTNGDVDVASSLVQVVSVAARRRRSRRPVALGGVLYSHVYSPAVSSLVSLSTSGVDAASTNTFEVSTSPSNRVSPDESTSICPLASDSAFGGTTGCPCSSAVTRSCRSSTWSLRIALFSCSAATAAISSSSPSIDTSTQAPSRRAYVFPSSGASVSGICTGGGTAPCGSMYRVMNSNGFTYPSHST